MNVTAPACVGVALGPCRGVGGTGTAASEEPLHSLTHDRPHVPPALTHPSPQLPPRIPPTAINSPIPDFTHYYRLLYSSPISFSLPTLSYPPLPPTPASDPDRNSLPRPHSLETHKHRVSHIVCGRSSRESDVKVIWASRGALRRCWRETAET